MEGKSFARFSFILSGKPVLCWPIGSSISVVALHTDDTYIMGNYIVRKRDDCIGSLPRYVCICALYMYVDALGLMIYGAQVIIVFNDCKGEIRMSTMSYI